MLSPDDPRYGGEYAAQRACYVALRKKGWAIHPSKIAFAYFVAVKHGREESVSAKDFRELLNLASKRDAEWLERERAAERLRKERAAKEAG
jgi:hypothetical protein